MRILPTASVLLLAAVPAMAQSGPDGPGCEPGSPTPAQASGLPLGLQQTGAYPNVCQEFTASQDIMQTMELGGSVLEGAPAVAPPSDVPLALQQTGLNTVNMVQADQPVSNLTQRFSGTQNIENSIVAGALGALTSISQSGVNTANTIEGTTIEFAAQFMERGASQIVSNSLEVGGSLASISQTGDNLANIARADYAIGVGLQDIDSDTEQRVTNVLDLAAGSNIAETIRQSGTNVGNMLIADRIDSVIRRFDGTQIVDNTVILNDGSRPRISQSGNNIANFISAQSVGTIQQISTGSQIVTNRVIGPDGEEIEHANFEQTESNYMGASNVVNLMIVGSPGGGGTSNDEMTITQKADFEQDATGSQQSQSGNVLAINR